jgi:hypothetical protein
MPAPVLCGLLAWYDWTFAAASAATLVLILLALVLVLAGDMMLL